MRRLMLGCLVLACYAGCQNARTQPTPFPPPLIDPFAGERTVPPPPLQPGQPSTGGAAPYYAPGPSGQVVPPGYGPGGAAPASSAPYTPGPAEASPGRPAGSFRADVPPPSGVVPAAAWEEESPAGSRAATADAGPTSERPYAGRGPGRLVDPTDAEPLPRETRAPANYPLQRSFGQAEPIHVEPTPGSRVAQAHHQVLVPIGSRQSGDLLPAPTPTGSERRLPDLADFPRVTEDDRAATARTATDRRLADSSVRPASSPAPISSGVPITPGITTTGGSRSTTSTSAVPDARYGYTKDYRELRGKLEFSHVDRRWKLRYIQTAGATDPFGGSVRLADSPAVMEANLREGAFVTLRGRIESRDPADSDIAPLYFVQEIASE